MTDTILYSVDGPVARLVLNNPDKHNALGVEQLKAMAEHLSAAEGDTAVRILVLTGAGDKTFCAGASLQELGEGMLGDESFQKMTAQLAAMRTPSICALNGNVFGGGAELAVSCDFRIGVEGMRLRVPAATLGLCYPPLGIDRFVQCLGVSVTRRILVAAETFDTRALEQIGFLDRVVEREALADTASEFATHIAGLAPLAVQSMNAILRRMAAGTADADEAAALVSACLASDDLREGLAAQREKRTPRFSGK